MILIENQRESLLVEKQKKTKMYYLMGKNEHHLFLDVKMSGLKVYNILNI